MCEGQDMDVISHTSSLMKGNDVQLSSRSAVITTASFVVIDVLITETLQERMSWDKTYVQISPVRTHAHARTHKKIKNKKTPLLLLTILSKLNSDETKSSRRWPSSIYKSVWKPNHHNTVKERLFIHPLVCAFIYSFISSFHVRENLRRKDLSIHLRKLQTWDF